MSGQLPFRDEKGKREEDIVDSKIKFNRKGNFANVGKERAIAIVLKN